MSKELTTAEAMALCEFGDIPLKAFTEGLFCDHLNPPARMSAANYLNTAEGALRIFHAAENFELNRFLPLTGPMIYIAKACYHIEHPASEGCDKCGHGKWEPAHNTHHWTSAFGETAEEAILTAALELPVVRELVKKYEGEK